LLLILVHITVAQAPTIGLVYNNSPSKGCTLFSLQSNNDIYLIDNYGNKAHQYAFSEKPGLPHYLLGSGNRLRTGNDSMEIRAWDNSLVWYFPNNLNELKQHHDIESLPNCNIQCIITDNFTSGQIAQKGSYPANIGNNFRLDMIIELEPIYP